MPITKVVLYLASLGEMLFLSLLSANAHNYVLAGIVDDLKK